MLPKSIAIFAAALITSTASAHSTQASSHNPAVKNSAPHSVSAPARGANSFSRNQARGRFAKAGFTGLSGLVKRDGVWQGTAMKGGTRMTVMLDYKGNITTR